MRSWTITTEASAHFDTLLQQGAKLYEKDTISSKRDLVVDAIRLLASTPPGFENSYQRDTRLGLHRYRVRNTPFVLYFSITDSHVRILRIAHYHSDRSHLPRPTLA